MTGLTIMGSHIFGFLGVRQFSIFMVSKRTRMFVLQMKSKVFFIQSKKWVSLPLFPGKILVDKNYYFYKEEVLLYISLDA